MIQRRNVISTLLGVLSTMSAASLNRKTAQTSTPICAPHPAIVGAWHVQSVGAPILHHCLTFHVDGIMCSFQADGGFPNDSESDGAGEWQMVGNQVQGMFLEFRHDRESHVYLGSVRISFSVAVNGDTFTGDAQASEYDAQGNLLMQVYPQWSATRISPQTTSS